MHAFMHDHMTKYAEWNRKIIQICSIKIQFYIILHFYFFWNNPQLISPNCLYLSSCIYLTAHSWTWKIILIRLKKWQVHILSEEISGKVSLYYILLGEWWLEILVQQRKQVQLRVQSFIFSQSPHSVCLSLCLSVCLSLSLSLSHSYHA